MIGAVRPVAVVFCERPAPGTWAAGVLRELGAWLDVRPCGPRWPARDVEDVDPAGARLLLEVDTAPGCVARPGVRGARALRAPRAAWLVDTPCKPALHREAAAEADLVLHAHAAWAAALGRPSRHLPLCADEGTFREAGPTAREWDAVFVGHEAWRAAPLFAVARRRGLAVHVASPEGEDAKARAAGVYARARAVFHAHAAADVDPRVFEALVVGRVVLVDRRPSGLEGLVRPGWEVEVWGDEAELEARLVALLADPPGRAAREREAAAWARERLGARVRARELARALDEAFGLGLGLAPAPAPAAAAGAEPGGGATLEVATPAPTPLLAAPPPGEAATATATAATAARRPSVPAARGPSAARRWLVLADREPPAVGLASYAERLGAALHAAGDEVTIVRARRGRLPTRAPRPGAPRVVEVDSGPLPAALTAENATLLLAPTVQRVADEVAREAGPLHGVLVEPALGALVGVPLARRLGLPLVLALEDCEVARRANVLTRDQLYRSELEHGAADAAALVLVPAAAAAEAARAHYGATALATTGWPGPARLPEAAAGERLRARLGLPAAAPLVRAPGASRADAAALAAALAQRGGEALVVGQDGLACADAHGVRVLGARPVVGPALAALAAGARAVVHVGREDLGAADLALAAPAFGVAPDARPDEVLAALEAAAPGRRLAAWDPGVLERLARVAAGEPATTCAAGAAPGAAEAGRSNGGARRVPALTGGPA